MCFVENMLPSELFKMQVGVLPVCSIPTMRVFTIAKSVVPSVPVANTRPHQIATHKLFIYATNLTYNMGVYVFLLTYAPTWLWNILF